MLLIVVAVEAEAEALLTGLGGSDEPARQVAGCSAVRGSGPAGEELLVVTCGIGPVAAASVTAAACATLPVSRALSVGVAGGFDLAPGELVVADRIIAADLGATDTDGSFLGHRELGWEEQAPLPVPGAPLAAHRLGAHLGAVITVVTVTGTAARTAALRARYGPLAEAMEGAGVAWACLRHGVVFGEVRSVSNRVGPRETSAWDLPRALATLQRAAPGLASAFAPPAARPAPPPLGR